MKYSFNWLKEFVDFEKTPESLAFDLSCKSVEIGSIERMGGNYLDDVVVAKILEINPHPNADKLKIVTVDIGSSLHDFYPELGEGSRDSSTSLRSAQNDREKVLEVVCGAPNIEVGQKVPLALLGADLPGGKVKEAVIRGVKSTGMICAEDELGLGNDHLGILILDSLLEPGTRLSGVYNDWVLDGEVLSHRGDLQNHKGLAREISALYDSPLKSIDFLILKGFES